MQDEICIAGYMHDLLMITKAKVTANYVLTRPLIPASLFHNSALHRRLTTNATPEAVTHITFVSIQ